MTPDIRPHPNGISPGRHGYSAGCQTGYANQQSFSIGIFRYEPAETRKGIKRSAVLYRLKVPSLSLKTQGFQRAEEIATEMDTGKTFPKNSETLKTP